MAHAHGHADEHPALPLVLASILPHAKDVQEIISVIAKACGGVSRALAVSVVKKASVKNTYEDDVLTADLITDKIIGDALHRCALVAGFASEERPSMEQCNKATGKYVVAFDPLDGSSIVDANFSVGSIFGVWAGQELVGQRIGDQACSVFVVYGPRTVMFVATKAAGVFEFLLHGQNDWKAVTAQPLRIAPKAKYFAPGNLRAVNDVPWYRDVVAGYMQRGLTLRYTGGMVPDVAHIFIKGSGIFTTPHSAKHKMKLRVAFECGPLAFACVCAGGRATDGTADYMDHRIAAIDERSAVAMGSADDVAQYMQKAASQSASKL
jgi:sedoheptulose-bisphosphatase